MAHVWRACEAFSLASKLDEDEDEDDEEEEEETKEEEEEEGKGFAKT